MDAKGAGDARGESTEWVEDALPASAQYALCRCGESNRKPFCDGTHASTGRRRFCDPHGRVWNQVERTDDPRVRAQFIRQVGNCASGRLIAIDNETGKPIEPTLPQSIGVVAIA